MFARSVVRATARQVARPTVAITARAAIHNTARRQTPPEVIQERSVPVTSFEHGSVAHQTLQVSETHAPVNPAGQDDEAVARPLDPNVTKQLTPTLSKFTLHGKVAIVTG